MEKLGTVAKREWKIPAIGGEMAAKAGLEGLPEAGRRMVNTAFVKAQLNRFKGFHGFESHREELLRIALRDANSDAGLEQIVSALIDSRRPNEQGFVGCPTPAELADALSVAASHARFRRPAADCGECGGTGWALGRDRAGNEAVRRCDCAKTGERVRVGKVAASGRDA